MSTRRYDFEQIACSGPEDDGVLEVRLASGEKHNLMTAVMHRELGMFWAVLRGDAAVRSVLLLGGNDSFSAGSTTELMEPILIDAAARLRVLEEGRRIVIGALDCEVPVVAGVRGTAVGSALGAALLADICVVSETARLADGHARVGVVAGDHAVLVWPLLCGMANAKRYLLLPDTLSGEEARRIGLVAECVPDADVEPVAREFARRLACAAPLATRWTKRALAHVLRPALAAFDASLAYELLSYDTEDAREGVRSIQERRAPGFGGGASTTPTR